MPANDNGFFTPGRMMKLGVALMFDLLKFVFSLAVLFAPLIAGVALAAITYDKCNGILPDWSPGKGWVCGTAATVVGTAATTGGYALEFGTGIGFAAVEAGGEVLTDAVDFIAWCFFFLWFAVTGVKLFGGGRANSRFLIGMTSSVVGLVPILNMAPTVTIGVWGIEYQQWLEDKEKSVNDNVPRTRQERIEAQQADYADAA